MQLLKSSRPIVLFLFVAAAIVFYFANSGLAATLADDGDTASEEEEAPTLESLTERIAALESRIAEQEVYQDKMAAQGLAYPIFDTIAAVYLLDQVDIHALYEQLHEGEGIMPGDAGQIKRLVPLLSAVALPEELAEEGTALVEILSQLSVALADDDLESAVPLAIAAHEAQHHFSGSVSDWFVCTQLPEEDPDQEGQSDEGHGDDSDAHDDDHSDDDDSDEHGDDHCDDDDPEKNDDDGNDHSDGG